MKVLVPVKRVVDYNVKVRVKSDGTGVDIANVKMSMNPFDEIAVEEAVRLKEKGVVTEVIAVSCGVQQCQETLRTAMAIGADRAHPGRDRRRAAAAGGRQAAEGAGRQGTARPRHPRQAGDRRRLQPDRPDAGRARRPAAGHLRLEGRSRPTARPASRAKSTAASRRSRSTLPAVVTTDLRLNEPRYVTLPNIMKAKKKQLDVAQAGRPRRRRQAAPEDAQGERAAEARRRRQGARRGDAGRQAEERSEGDLTMAESSLVIAEHDNAAVQGGHAQHRHRRSQLRRRRSHVLIAGSERRRAAARPPRRSPASPRCCTPTPRDFAHGLAENVAAQVLALAERLQPHPVPGHARAARTSRRASPPSSTSARSPTSPRSIAPDTFERPIYAGNAIATVQSLDAVKVITVRTTGFDPAAATGGSAAVETRAAASPMPARRASSASEIAKNDRPELTAAKIIVSGGRALGSSDKFNEVLTPLADKLGAALGASRAAVDAGYAPERLAGRPDRQDRRAAALHRRRHQRRDPAPGRHEGLEGDRRDQQGRRRRRSSASPTTASSQDLFTAVPELVKAL